MTRSATRTGSKRFGDLLRNESPSLRLFLAARDVQDPEELDFHAFLEQSHCSLCAGCPTMAGCSGSWTA